MERTGSGKSSLPVIGGKAKGAGGKGASQFLPSLTSRQRAGAASAQPIRRCPVPAVNRGVASATLRRQQVSRGNDWNHSGLTQSEDHVVLRAREQEEQKVATMQRLQRERHAQGGHVRPQVRAQLPAVSPSLVWDKGRGLCDLTARANKELNSVFPLLSPLSQQPEGGAGVETKDACETAAAAGVGSDALVVPPAGAPRDTTRSRRRRGDPTNDTPPTAPPVAQVVVGETDVATELSLTAPDATSIDADIDYISSTLRSLQNSTTNPFGTGKSMGLLDDWRDASTGAASATLPQQYGSGGARVVQARPGRGGAQAPTSPAGSAVSVASGASSSDGLDPVDTALRVLVAVAGGVAGQVTAERVYYARVLRYEEEHLATMIFNMRRRWYATLAAVAAAASLTNIAGALAPRSLPDVVAAALAAAVASIPRNLLSITPLPSPTRTGAAGGILGWGSPGPLGPRRGESDGSGILMIDSDSRVVDHLGMREDLDHLHDHRHAARGTAGGDVAAAHPSYHAAVYEEYLVEQGYYREAEGHDAVYDDAPDPVAMHQPQETRRLQPTVPAQAVTSAGGNRHGSGNPKRRRNAGGEVARSGGGQSASRRRSQSASRRTGGAGASAAGKGRAPAAERRRRRADRRAARIDEWERIISEMDMATLKLYVASLNGHFGPEHYSALLRLSMEDVVVGPNASHRQIASLKQRAATPGDEAQQCVICMDSYTAGCGVAEFPKCGHVFHEECALEYLQEYGKCCPLCKSTLDTPLSSARPSPLHSAQGARPHPVAAAVN